MSLSILAVILWVTAPFLYGACAAWLASRPERSIRFWAEHPWRIFWALFPFILVGLVLVFFGFTASGIIFIGVPGGLCLLSAVHVLYATWRRSQKRALIMVSIVWAVLIAGAFYEAHYLEGYPPAQAIKLAAAFLSVPFWVIGALVVAYVSRWFTGKRQSESFS